MIRIVPLLFLAAPLWGQPAKNTTASKVSVPEKPVPGLIKAAFLKRNFLLDTTLFSAKVLINKSGSEELNISIKNFPGASVSITKAEASLVTETRNFLQKEYGANWAVPNAAGFTYVYASPSAATTLSYEGKSIQAIEYKAVYHGTRGDRELAKAMANMPKPRTLDANGRVVEKKDTNEFDTDENNRINRTYLLNLSPGIDKGFLMLFYEANFGEDKKKDGPKLLQTLVSSITRMKINEQIKFVVVKEPKLLIDFALPKSSGGDGFYSFETPLVGGFQISVLKNTAAGYANIIETSHTVTGEVTERGAVEEHTLRNGIKIFTSVNTVERAGNEYASVWHELLTILVPDKKTIKQPIFIKLRSFSSDPLERNALNTFILNSISPQGKLTEAIIDKIKSDYLVP